MLANMIAKSFSFRITAERQKEIEQMLRQHDFFSEKCDTDFLSVVLTTVKPPP